MKDLLEELKRAVDLGDRDAIERIQRKIVNAGRDEDLDKDFIESIRGKTLYRNIIKAINDDNNEMGFYELSKLSTSIITHCLIESQLTGRDINDYPVRDFYVVLGSFINEQDHGKAIEECKELLKEHYQQFI